MIKYLEMTAPETGEFRQAKILSIMVNEGDTVLAGDALFRVKSGSQEIDLPSRLDGKIVEVIAVEGENISSMTPLVLIETEVDKSTAEIKPQNAPQTKEETAPVHKAPNEAPVKKKSKKKVSKTTTKKVTNKAVPSTKQKNEDQHQQQLDLSGGNPTISINDNQESTVSDSNQTASATIAVAVPDIGGDSAKVVEILVNVGDTVAVEDSLVTLESDKASMDVPSSHAGVVQKITVTIDQDVEEGTVIVELAGDETGETSASAEDAPSAPETPAPMATKAEPIAAATSSSDSVEEVKIPDIGGDTAKVIEILVSIGDSVNVEDPLVTLESDKASMDVPSSVAGEIQSIEVSIDQEVGEGVVVAKVVATGMAASDKPSGEAAVDSALVEKPATAPAPTPPAAAPAAQQTAPAAPAEKSHASPSIRRFARELGVTLSQVSGSGRKGRIIKEDVKAFVKGVMSGGGPTKSAESGSGIPPIPAQDFSKFGETETLPLNRIKRLTAQNLHRSWLNVPHVTHNDESNINDLESFRKQLNSEYAKQNKSVKLSPLAFIVKAVVNAMQTYPQFNSSLDESGENLIYKKYFNVGIAVDTPNGLVVPVVKGADKMNVTEIAEEMGALAAKARDKKLTGADMSGACFTISSLGGIGGTHFTPIVNAPEVAILGVSRSKMKPVWNGSEFVPGMILPLSLSYDHRVIDGAEAARFTRHIAAVLEDVRRLTV